jgi:hypothetical protein
MNISQGIQNCLFQYFMGFVERLECHPSPPQKKNKYLSFLEIIIIVMCGLSLIITDLTNGHYNY